MDEKSVTILTGSGKGLGTGHLQRMLGLASYINRTSSTKALILDRNINSFFPDSTNILTVNNIPENTSLIIRDMRDSQSEEIESLKRTAPVLVIDDAGTGRYSTDYRVDLLPGLHDGNIPRPDLFLYGYNFTDSLNTITSGYIEKKTDLLINSSAFEDNICTDTLLKLLPENFKSIIIDKNSKLQGPSYAENLISSKVVLTHFGILLYEAYISGCSISTLDPTDYHRMLSEKAAETLSLTNIGLVNTKNCSAVAETILKLVEAHENCKISINSMKRIIRSNLENFLGLIEEIIE